MENETNMQFGMTEQETKDYNRNAIFGRLKYYFSTIEPGVIKIINVAIYYVLRFIKAFVTTTVRMILGKET